MTVEYPNVIQVLVDGDRDDTYDKSWHMATVICGDPAVLCTGEYYGYGIGDIDNEDGHHYNEKVGKITCDSCRNIIKLHKGVKL